MVDSSPDNLNGGVAEFILGKSGVVLGVDVVVVAGNWVGKDV